MGSAWRSCDHTGSSVGCSAVLQAWDPRTSSLAPKGRVAEGQPPAGPSLRPEWGPRRGVMGNLLPPKVCGPDSVSQTLDQGLSDVPGPVAPVRLTSFPPLISQLGGWWRQTGEDTYLGSSILQSVCAHVCAEACKCGWTVRLLNEKGPTCHIPFYPSTTQKAPPQSLRPMLSEASLSASRDKTVVLPKAACCLGRSSEC